MAPAQDYAPEPRGRRKLLPLGPRDFHRHGSGSPNAVPSLSTGRQSLAQPTVELPDREPESLLVSRLQLDVVADLDCLLNRTGSQGVQRHVDNLLIAVREAEIKQVAGESQ